MSHNVSVKCKVCIEDLQSELVSQILEEKFKWKILQKKGKWSGYRGQKYDAEKQLIVPRSEGGAYGGELDAATARELGISDPQNWRTVALNPGEEVKEVKQGEGGAYERVVGRALTVTLDANEERAGGIGASLEAAVKTAKGLEKVRALNRESASVGGPQINEKAATDAILNAIRSKQGTVIQVRSKKQQTMGI